MYSQRTLPPASVEKMEHIGLMQVCESRATLAVDVAGQCNRPWSTVRACGMVMCGWEVSVPRTASTTGLVNLNRRVWIGEAS